MSKNESPLKWPTHRSSPELTPVYSVSAENPPNPSPRKIPIPVLFPEIKSKWPSPETSATRTNSGVELDAKDIEAAKKVPAPLFNLTLNNPTASATTISGKPSKDNN